MIIIQDGITDIGAKRKVNQDSILIKLSEDKKTSLCVVADGMGGHSQGEVASSTITEYLEKWWEEFNPKNFDDNFANMISSIQDCVNRANEKIYNEYNNGDVCGSTCILLFIHEGIYGVMNAGDSHIYMKRGIITKSVMIDDVWENQNSVKSVLSANEIKKHPNCGKLVNAIGTTERVSLSIKTAPLKSNDTFILCSDGLYKYCPTRFIKKAIWSINDHNIHEKIIFLKDKTYAAGAKDNISVIIVKVL